MRALEARARERGCTRFDLETFSFQAPARYRSLGCRVVHTIRGFAPGIEKHLMVREEHDDLS